MVTALIPASVFTEYRPVQDDVVKHISFRHHAFFENNVDYEKTNTIRLLRDGDGGGDQDCHLSQGERNAKR